MTINQELLAPFIGALAAIASVLLVFFKWADEQEKAKHEQRSREIRNVVLAEVYRELLRLNVQWLSGNEAQRNVLDRRSDEETDSALESRSAD